MRQTQYLTRYLSSQEEWSSPKVTLNRYILFSEKSMDADKVQGNVGLILRGGEGDE